MACCNKSMLALLLMACLAGASMGRVLHQMTGSGSVWSYGTGSKVNTVTLTNTTYSDPNTTAMVTSLNAAEGSGKNVTTGTFGTTGITVDKVGDIATMGQGATSLTATGKKATGSLLSEQYGQVQTDSARIQTLASTTQIAKGPMSLFATGTVKVPKRSLQKTPRRLFQQFLSGTSSTYGNGQATNLTTHSSTGMSGNITEDDTSLGTDTLNQVDATSTGTKDTPVTQSTWSNGDGLLTQGADGSIDANATGGAGLNATGDATKATLLSNQLTAIQTASGSIFSQGSTLQVAKGPMTLSAGGKQGTAGMAKKPTTVTIESSKKKNPGRNLKQQFLSGTSSTYGNGQATELTTRSTTGMSGNATDGTTSLGTDTFNEVNATSTGTKDAPVTQNTWSNGEGLLTKAADGSYGANATGDAKLNATGDATKATLLSNQLAAIQTATGSIFSQGSTLQRAKGPMTLSAGGKQATAANFKRPA